MHSVFKEPIFYTVLIALALKGFNIQPSKLFLAPFRFIGDVTPALALFALGIRLGSVKIKISRALVLSVFLRLVGGTVCGWIVVKLLNLQGIIVPVVLIASSLPSAVFSYIIAERYDSFPENAASAVFVTTILALPWLPILILLIS